MLNVTVTTSRTPYYELPITLVQKATRTKVYRKLHCLECGMPFAEITDKVVAILDFASPLAEMSPDGLGVVACHCPRKICQQRYRFEFPM